jgi:TetR/AcrR family transcriptional regulator of autoinduction and epiphytic fitness
VTPGRPPSDAKREAILAAALKAFRDGGFTATSMDSIAESANVSKRTVYNHFPSKDMLFDVVTDKLWSLLVPLGEALPATDLSVEERLTQLAERRLEVLLQPDLLMLLKTVMSESLSAPELQRAFVGGREISHGQLGLRALLTEETRKGRLKVEQLDIAGGQFWGLILNPLFWPMLLGLKGMPTDEERDLVISEAVATFVARYGLRRRHK